MKTILAIVATLFILAIIAAVIIYNWYHMGIPLFDIVIGFLRGAIEALPLTGNMTDWPSWT